MRNVYKKWEINSAKMNKAICAEWDGKLRVLSRQLAARTGTDEQFSLFQICRTKIVIIPVKWIKKSPYLSIRGFFGLLQPVYVDWLYRNCTSRVSRVAGEQCKAAVLQRFGQIEQTGAVTFQRGNEVLENCGRVLERHRRRAVIVFIDEVDCVVTHLAHGHHRGLQHLPGAGSRR